MSVLGSSPVPEPNVSPAPNPTQERHQRTRSNGISRGIISPLCTLTPSFRTWECLLLGQHVPCSGLLRTGFPVCGTPAAPPPPRPLPRETGGQVLQWLGGEEQGSDTGTRRTQIQTEFCPKQGWERASAELGQVTWGLRNRMKLPLQPPGALPGDMCLRPGIVPRACLSARGTGEGQRSQAPWSPGKLRQA